MFAKNSVFDVKENFAKVLNYRKKGYKMGKHDKLNVNCGFCYGGKWHKHLVVDEKGILRCEWCGAEYSSVDIFQGRPNPKLKSAASRRSIARRSALSPRRIR